MSDTIQSGTFVLLLLMGPAVPASVNDQSFTYAKVGGCENILLYGWNEEQTELLVVRADRKALGLKDGTSKLRLGEKAAGLDVRIDLFQRSFPRVDYCSDVRGPDEPKPVATLRGRGGDIDVRLGKRGAVRGAQSFMYEAQVTLRNVVFERPDGSTVVADAPITLRAVVGFYWG